MPDTLTPASGTTPDRVLSKQSYNTDNITQHMFHDATQKGRKSLIPPTVIKGVTIQQLWDHVFADDSDFLKRYHDRREETDLEIGPWTYAPDKSNGYRFISMTTIIDIPRAGTKTQLNEAHRFAYVTTDSNQLMLVYQISSQTPNVMSGSSFRVDSYIEITAASPEAECTIAFWGSCKKLSSFLIVPISVIETRAMKDMTTGYRLMVEMITDEMSGAGAAAAEAPPAAAAAAITTATTTEADANADAATAATTTTTTSTTTAAGGATVGYSEVMTATTTTPQIGEVTYTTTGGLPPGSEMDTHGSQTAMAFQGILMVLAFVVAFYVMWSASTVRHTAMDAAQLSRAVRGLETQYASVQDHSACTSAACASSSISSSLHFDKCACLDSAHPPLTEEQALYNAAREAQINTLRYRWLEQRDAIRALENSQWWMQWFIFSLFCMVTALSLKVWFFSDKAGDSTRSGSNNMSNELMTSTSSLPLVPGVPTQEVVYTTAPVTTSTITAGMNVPVMATTTTTTATTSSSGNSMPFTTTMPTM